MKKEGARLFKEREEQEEAQRIEEEKEAARKASEEKIRKKEEAKLKKEQKKEQEKKKKAQEVAALSTAAIPVPLPRETKQPPPGFEEIPAQEVALLRGLVINTYRCFLWCVEQSFSCVPWIGYRGASSVCCDTYSTYAGSESDVEGL